MTPPNIILIGLRGSGKSTVGRMAAERMGRIFVDLDDLTPRELGHDTVASAWAARGEPAFRAGETAALGRVLGATGLLISLGGGTPTAPGADAALRRHRDVGGALIIYLHASPEWLRSRLEIDENSHRPALTPGETCPLAEIERVYALRDGLYRTLANVLLETGGRTPAEVVDGVVAACGSK